MARSTAVAAPVESVEEVVVEPTTDEAVVAETQAEVEGTDAETPAPEGEAAPVEADKPIDLTKFKALVGEAVEASDDTTGEVPEANMQAVRAEYQALDGIKAKNAAKGFLAEQLKTYLVSVNGPAARTIMELTEKAAVAGKSGGSTPAKVVDPTEAFTSNVAALTLALFIAQQAVPEGVDADAAKAAATAQATEAFEKAIEVYNSDNQETDVPLIKSAIRLVSTKAKRSGGTGTRVPSGERRDLGAHIAAAFAAAEDGKFLTVAEIRKFDSGIYTESLPSAGAITNRLRPKSGKPTTIGGIEVAEVGGKLGAYRRGEVVAGADEDSADEA